MSNNPVYWTMRNGQQISVDNMDLNHLRNTLKMIIKNSQKVQTTCPHNATQALEMGNIERSFQEDQLDDEMAQEFNNYHHECDATEIDIY